MKYCLIIIAIVASVYADDSVDVTEDTLGNYKFNIHSGDVQKSETRAHDGSVAGSFSYTDDKGNKHVLHYTGSEQGGFQATGADVPVSVPEGHEILSARQEHLRALANERTQTFPQAEHIERPASVGEVLHKLANEFQRH